MKRLIATLLVLLCLFSLCPAALAADRMEDSRFYSKQQRSRTCTLAAATMMLRRRAYLNGDETFADITESAVRKRGWWDGLSHDFTYNDMHVGYGTLPRDEEEKDAALIALLEQHPEGIVVYDRREPHAILLTDYTDGVFYCSDPARDHAAGRIAVDYASISLRGVSCYWYIDIDPNTHYGTAAVDKLSVLGMFYPANVQLGSGFSLGGMLRSPEGVTITQVELQVLDAQGGIVKYAACLPNTASCEWSFRELNTQLTFGDLAEGSYYFYLLARDSHGETLTFAESFTVSTAETVTQYYWSNKPAA
ncbi:MAG: hypothetical protein IJ347_02960 [Faecalibacterium sp.]|nr:hypothetical protein [Faecalibacterium sp.]